MEPRSLEDRIKQAVERESRKTPIERWNALIARGAIDSTGRVLLRAPRPMKGGASKENGEKKV
jgi:hypothetical protein